MDSSSERAAEHGCDHEQVGCPANGVIINYMAVLPVGARLRGNCHACACHHLLQWR